MDKTENVLIANKEYMIMSDMAEDMADGTTCSICGQYFQDPDDTNKAFTHGFPVACKKCFRSGMRRDGIQKATVKTI